jgi:hypothetical protein
MTRIRKKGDSLGSLQLQPGWVIENDGFGLLTSKLTFVCDADKAATLAPKKNAPHPSDGKLTCHRSSYVINDNGLAVITSEYIGIATGSITGFQVSGDVGLASQPIQTHPKFTTAANGELALKDLGWDIGLQAFPETNGTAIANGLVGVKSYLSPDIQITGQFYTSSIAVVQDVQKMVGKTFATIPSMSDFLIPSVGVGITKKHDRFCFVTGMSYETYSTIHKIKFTFRVASGGWNNLVYQKHN